MKLRTILFAVIGLIILCLGSIVFLSRSTQRSLKFDNELAGGFIPVPFKGKPYTVELMPGLNFKFDTGADISSISQADLEKIRAMGYDVEEKFYPVVGRDGYGSFIFTAKRYTVSLPVGEYEARKDSAGVETLAYTGRVKNVIRKVDFAATDEPMSSFGLDFLKSFKFEWKPELEALALRNDIPADYHKIASMQKNVHLLDNFWSGDRCYVILSVNQHPHIFLLDTGLQDTSVKLPMRDSVHVHSELRTDSVRTMRSTFVVRVDDKGWVDIGSRSGTRRVYYYDNVEDDYQFNPFNAYKRDLLIDLDGLGIYFSAGTSGIADSSAVPVHPPVI